MRTGPINLRLGDQWTPEYRQTNPQALVPTLVTEGRTLTQSLAIIEYLDEIHPEPPLLPKAPLERARVRALAMMIACDIHPINNLRVTHYLADPWIRTKSSASAGRSIGLRIGVCRDRAGSGLELLDGALLPWRSSRPRRSVSDSAAL